MRATILAGGTFTAYRLAEQLASRGALDRLIATHPPLRGERIPRDRLVWNPLPELWLRSGWPDGHYRKAVSFGHWAAKHVGQGDLAVCWAQFALESLRKCRTFGIRTILVRQSTHILNQIALLRLPRTPLVERELEEYSVANHIEVPTQLAKRTFVDHGVPEEKLIVVPPVGIDSKVFYPPSEPPKEFRAITVGVSKRKGTRIACEAAQMAGVKLWVVGRPDVPIQPFREGFGPSVEFLGPVSQRRLADLYRQSSVAIIASIEEGLAHSVVEALACGVPVVASIESGAQEVISFGKEGWFIIYTDHEMAAEYLWRLKASEILRTRMSAAAAETGRRWSWPAYGARAMEAYNQIVSRETIGTPTS